MAGTGLHPGEATLRVDLQDAVEARHHQQNALGQWQCATGQAGAGATRHYRYTRWWHSLSSVCTCSRRSGRATSNGTVR